MAWFKRTKEGILTATEDKLEVPEGIWFKCPNCKKTIATSDLVENLYVCPQCGYHSRINSSQYFPILYDEGKFKLLFESIRPIDFLHFTDLKSYEKRLEDTKNRT